MRSLACKFLQTGFAFLYNVCYHHICMEPRMKAFIVNTNYRQARTYLIFIKLIWIWTNYLMIKSMASINTDCLTGTYILFTSHWSAIIKLYKRPKGHIAHLSKQFSCAFFTHYYVSEFSQYGGMMKWFQKICGGYSTIGENLIDSQLSSEENSLYS